MNFNQFAIRNTLRNGHLYLAYFLSTMFAVMVFFTFSVFVFHPTLNDGDLNRNVQVGMKIAAVIIYLFSFFFVMYSMDVFLQSRKKEFGTLMIQGMSPRQLRRMVFIENMVIGTLATIAGSLAGILFSQVILAIAKSTIRIELGFYFPTMPIILTIAAFLLLFLLISVFIQFKLPKLNLQDLLKANELGKGTIKVSPVKAILGIVMIAAGYVLASIVREPVFILMVFVPVVILVILGTKFLFDQLSVLLIEKIRRNPNRFWKKTNMVVFSDLAFRMKDNARSFFLVTIISTVAFSAIGTLFGFGGMLTTGFKDVNYDFGAGNATQEQITKTDAILKDYGIDYTQETYTYYYGGTAKFINVSDYNRQAKAMGDETVTLGAGVIQIMPNGNSGKGREKQSTATVNGKKYGVDNYITGTGISAPTNTFIIPDGIVPENTQKSEYTVWKAHNASEKDLIDAGNKIGLLEVNASAAGYDLIMKIYSPVMFVGLFVGIVFFVSAGSFLYFRLYSDMEDDVEKFRMIHKLGLSKKELKKMINQQIGILFFTPIIVSICHGVIALNTMYHAFNSSLQLNAVLVLVAFAAIQVLYYLICRSFYFRSVYNKITA